mgnify:CR=1 FL=1
MMETSILNAGFAKLIFLKVVNSKMTQILFKYMLCCVFEKFFTIMNRIFVSFELLIFSKISIANHVSKLNSEQSAFSWSMYFFQLQGLVNHITCFKIYKYDENGDLCVVNTHHVSVLCENEKKESAVNVALFMKSLEIFEVNKIKKT